MAEFAARTRLLAVEMDVGSRYGESAREVFRGLERHDTYEDRPDLPHVLIVEAEKGDADPAALAAFNALLEREFLSFRSD